VKTGIDALSWIDRELELIRALNRERLPVHLSSAPGPEILVDGQSLIHLCSNNYLGLAADPRLKDAAVEATRRLGTGSGASRLVSGGSTLHRALEQRISAWKGTEDAIVFSSGYLANVGTIPGLAGPGDRILSDSLNHASVIDGCRLSGARIEIYAHGDSADLAHRLAVPHDGRTLVVTDSVFSMDGDLAPLPAICETCEHHGAMLMVDEAHAAGILGERGAGAVEHFGLNGRVPIVMGTLSKALGSAGGYVAGPSSLITLLRNRARSFIFDTAPPPAPLAAALTAIDIVESEPERRTRAVSLAQRLAGSLRAIGYSTPDPSACIVPVLLGDEETALATSASVRGKGVFAPAIRPPSVPAGSCRIRLTTMATHTDDMIVRATNAFVR
jgi:8-amino-7-oxononanoate synthase